MLHIALLIITAFGTAQSEQEQQMNIPASIIRAFEAKKLNQLYDFSFRLNPMYLRGDFDGDQKMDIAILVQDKKTKKNGIAIWHAKDNTVHILGAGKQVGNGGNDFTWMDVWSVYPKGRVYRGVGEKTAPRLLGEALLVQKSESASGLIYWNGQKYVWYQQGD